MLPLQFFRKEIVTQSLYRHLTAAATRWRPLQDTPVQLIQNKNWMSRVPPNATLCFSLSFSLLCVVVPDDLSPVQVCVDWHAGSDWSVHLVRVWNHHHGGSGMSAHCVVSLSLLITSQSVYIPCICSRRPPSPVWWSMWWTHPAASTLSLSCPTCCTPAGTSTTLLTLSLIFFFFNSNYSYTHHFFYQRNRDENTGLLSHADVEPIRYCWCFQCLSC